MHDPQAIGWLKSSLAEEVENAFAGQTRVVVTGDLSGRGGEESVGGAVSMVRKINRALALPPALVIYGNHDVWFPAEGSLGFPALSAAHELNTGRSELRRRYFPGPWPQIDLLRIPAKNERELRIHGLDTVLHDPVWNTLAQGLVQNDRYWDEHPGPDQLVTLKNELRPQDINIVLTHHPVHDPALNPLSGFLGNADEVARAFRGSRGEPLVQLVLSGHTHSTFPESLPQRVDSDHAHEPLGPNQAQLTAGTTLQTSLALEGARPQSWQRLTLGLENDDLVVERVVFNREGAGPFMRMPPEEMRLRLNPAR